MSAIESIKRFRSRLEFNREHTQEPRVTAFSGDSQCSQCSLDFNCDEMKIIFNHVKNASAGLNCDPWHVIAKLLSHSDKIDLIEGKIPSNELKHFITAWIKLGKPTVSCYPITKE